MTSGRILAIDFGTKRIGIAISDELQWTAQPFQVIERKSDDFVVETIKKIVEEQGVIKIVVGIPITLKGEIGQAADRVLNFVQKIQNKLNIPIVTWDESLTTVEAEDVLIKADLSRRKRKKIIDKLAAALILDSYLRAQKNKV